MMRDMTALLSASPVFAGLDGDQIDFIAGCGWNVHFNAGDTIFKFGEPADRFFVLRGGTVSIEIRLAGGPARRIETLGEGEVLGWSWLFPPYTWQFDARAMSDVRATAFDGSCLRDKCEHDPELGYELMKRFAGIVTTRLQATRLQLLDLYGQPL